MKWILLLLLSFSALATTQDQYPDFATLAQNEVQDQDYRIIVSKLQAPVTIFAIHGGLIEPGSDELARAMAEDKHSLYIFEGLKVQNPFSLHITATHFDEPQAFELAQNSSSCISIHGYIGDGSKAICVGGNDKVLAEKIVKTLVQASFEVIYPCRAFPATHPKNIVNRCLNKGVQLEISQGLWDAMALNVSLKTHLTQTLKSTLREARGI
jgi:phage replication-related protein YjqB (UPF0714/DUF867 family)